MPESTALQRRHRLVKDIFAEACLRPRSSRRSWLAAACGDDGVRAEVESLLAVFERHDTAPERGPLRLRRGRPRARFRRGALVAGRYRVERLLGSGGMGEVY